MRLVRGLLGWSNKRSGVEFYRWDDKIVPRHGSEWGDLLTMDPGVEGQEGAPVLVVVLPRGATLEFIEGVEREVAEAVAVRMAAEALLRAREALARHQEWCGHNRDAPGDPSFSRAQDAFEALEEFLVTRGSTGGIVGHPVGDVQR